MNAAIYIRKSREDKDKPSHRLTVQREQLPAYAASQGWTYEIYDDGHASAARGKAEGLKERARLEADARAGKIDVILTIELSRLSRDDTMLDFMTWLALCRDHGVKLATPSQIIDPRQTDHWVLSGISGILSSAEMQQLQKRMREGREEAFRRGQFNGGICPAPYVYDHALRRPKIDPDQLLQVDRIWTMAETMSAHAIATELCIPEIQVRRTISDRRLLFCQALRLDPSTGDMIACEWEPCLDAERAKRIRAGRRTRVKGNDRRPYAALLSGLSLLYCGYCGSTIKTWGNTKIRKDGTRNDYYGCRQKDVRRRCEKARLVPQGVLEEKILTNVFNTVSDTRELEQYWELWQQNNDPREALDQLTERIRREEGKKARLVGAISEGVIEFADAKKKMTELNASIERLEGERRALVQGMTPAPDWESLAMTREEFDAMDPEDQREALRMMVQRVDVYENYAIITYPFPRDATGSDTSRIQLPTREKKVKPARDPNARAIASRENGKKGGRPKRRT